MLKKILIFISIGLYFCGCRSSILDDPSYAIMFQVPEQAHVKLTVENSYNTLISELINKELSAGNHSVHFSAENLAEGVYFYIIEIKGTNSGFYQKTTKFLLLVK